MSDAGYAPDDSAIPGASAFIQWKGTDACLDFTCECGASEHYDGGFAYAIRCPECRRIWITPHTVALNPAPDGYEGCVVLPEEGTWKTGKELG